MKLAHEGEELVTVNGSLNIEIETVFELAFGDLTALELYEVDTARIETGHYAEEGSGAVGYVDHHACAIGTRIDFGFLGNADETGLVVVAVLHG